MLTTLLGGPLDGAELVLTGFTRPTFSTKQLLTEGSTDMFEGGPPLVVRNDDGNFVAVWPDGFRIWPESSPVASGGFRHRYAAVPGVGYKYAGSSDTPLTPIA